MTTLVHESLSLIVKQTSVFPFSWPHSYSAWSYNFQGFQIDSDIRFILDAWKKPYRDKKSIVEFFYIQPFKMEIFSLSAFKQKSQ